MTTESANILEILHGAYYQLTASERRIADYVLANYSKVQFMSISELAEASAVSEATISRFCKSVGIRSFNQFKIELAAYMASNPNAADSGHYDPDNLKDRIRKSSRLIQEAVSQTIEITDPSQIHIAVDILEKADHVMCIGSGGSMVIATECAHLFHLASHKFFEVSDSHRQITVAATMDSRDAIILFSYSGATTDGIDILQLAKEQGCKTILITRFHKSPAAKLADVVLCCGSSEGPYQSGSIPAAVAQLFVIDILFQEDCHRNRDTCMDHIHRVANALSAKHI